MAGCWPQTYFPMGYQEITNEVECAASFALIFAELCLISVVCAFSRRSSAPARRPGQTDDILEFGGWAGAVSR